MRQYLTLGAEPVLLVVAVPAAALLKDLKGPLSYLDVYADFRQSGSLGGGGLRRDNNNFIQLWLFLSF